MATLGAKPPERSVNRRESEQTSEGSASQAKVERRRRKVRHAADLEAFAQVFMYSPEGSITDHRSKVNQIQGLFKTWTRKLRL